MIEYMRGREDNQRRQLKKTTKETNAMKLRNLCVCNQNEVSFLPSWFCWRVYEEKMKRMILILRKKAVFVTVYSFLYDFGSNVSFTRNCVLSLFSFTPEKHFSLQSSSDNHFPVRILKASSILFSLLFSFLWHSLLKINHFHLSLFFPSASPCDSYTELLLSVSLLSSIISFFVAFYVSLGEVIFCLLLFLSSSVMSVLQTASLIVLSCMRYDAPSAMTLAWKSSLNHDDDDDSRERSLLPKNKRHKTG